MIPVHSAEILHEFNLSPHCLKRNRVVWHNQIYFTFITMNDQQTDPQKTVYIFTDGACSGNPGRGGYGVILRYGNHEKELSGGFLRTTNNRMELMAIIKGLEALKADKCNVLITSDSKYVIEAFNQGWIYGWEKRGWKKV